MSSEALVAVAAALAAILYIAIAGLHAYWALGGVWPGTDRESLHRIVVGGPLGAHSPGPIATWMVAAILVGAASTVLGGSGLVHVPIPRGWLRIVALVGAGVMVVRGLEGFVDTRLRPETAGGRFAHLNVRLYSPLCLVLALCTATALLW